MHALNFLSMSRCLGETWRLVVHFTDHLSNYILAHGGAALAMPKCVHREPRVILSFKKPRGSMA